MDYSIGARLQAIRKTRGMTQRKLAKISGVSNTTISQIEAGALNPTVGMIKKILDAVPISLSDFFSDEIGHEENIFYSAQELVEIAEGGVSYLQIGTDLSKKSIQMMKECYQPGTSTGKHPLTHAGEECGVIIEGCLKITVGDKTKVLMAGDAYYFKSNQPHTFKNDGHKPCVLITACTPPTF